MPNQFMDHSSEVVKSPSDARFFIKQASCVRCVDTSGARWDMLIWFADMNFHTSSIQDSICSHFWVSMYLFSNMRPPLLTSSFRVDRLFQRSGINGVDFQECLMRKSILPVPWITKGSKQSMPPRKQGPYLTAVLRVLLMPALVIPNFMIGCMMCLHYFFFSFMVDQRYFIVWVIIELKDFHAFFCWAPPTLIEVAHAVAFLRMYLKWYLLLPSGARYIPNMIVASFYLR